MPQADRENNGRATPPRWAADARAMPQSAWGQLRVAVWNHRWLWGTVGLGLFIAFAGSILSSRRAHGVSFIAGGDTVLYLQFAAQARRSGALADPATGAALTLYPKLIFVPPGLLARAAGLPPLAMLTLWRLWAGLSLAGGFYAVFYLWFRRSWVAALGAACVLAEPGAAWLRWLAGVILGWFRGGGMPLAPSLQPLWRIVDPADSLAVLLLFAALLIAARRREDARPTAPHPWWRDLWLWAAACGLGLSFYTLFYDWTAAGLALVLVLLVDRQGRRLYLAVGSLGVVLGLPAIWHGLQIRSQVSPSSLVRMNVFVAVTRFSGAVRHLGALALLLLFLPWVLRRPGERAYVWSLGLASWLLSVSQIVTGVQIQNNHWYRMIVRPLVAALLVAVCAAGFGRWRRWRTAGVALAGVLIVSGVAAHLLVAAHQQNSLWIRNLRRLQQDEPRSWAGGRMPVSTVAGSLGLSDDASILFPLRPLSGYASLVSPVLSDSNWEWRWALNEYVQGRTPDQFNRDLNALLSTLFGPLTGRSADGPIMAVAEQRALIAGSVHDAAAIAARPAPYLDRFHVQWILLDPGRAPPAAVRRLARPVEAGSGWVLWRRRGCSGAKFLDSLAIVNQAAAAATRRVFQAAKGDR